MTLNTEKAQTLGALGMVLLAMAAVVWLAVEGSEQAQGALISVVSSGAGYYLRGKLANPTP